MITVLLLLLMMKSGTVSAVSSVTFENQDLCALKGSSVTLRCLYNYTVGKTVRKTAWFKGHLEKGLWKRVELSGLPSYRNRTEYLGDRQHNCSLAIHDLREDDTGHYYFRFDTDTLGIRSRGSVFLTVSEVRARVHPATARAGKKVTLECVTSCTPASTLWFKDGHPITKSLLQAQAEDAGKYSCTVKGHESVQSHPVDLNVLYSPVNVSVKVSHAGLLAVGRSVNLTCSSAANPKADSYTWYSSRSLLQVASGRVLSLNSLEVSHSGLYLCQVRNRLGENNSTAVLLTVGETKITRFILLLGIGIKVVMVLFLTLIITWAWRDWFNSAEDNEMDSHDYENCRM
ncbi:B-cell receptor CD22-like [Archocentrus centrarchus]|uniref:B-cell receptor CD22-like n=1 Tax=Archocentrus centrarchus TaxID=63155 RepID=UPI0011E9C99D|nr:B-cell receptor CD22-like [Archocentrus centrarchus]